MKRASFTVETALVFPLFFFAVIALIYIVMWFQTAEKIQKELTDKARIISASAYADISGAREDEEDIVLSRDYTVRIRCPVLSLLPLKLHQSVHIRKFTGVYDIADGEDSDIVYITANGRVYHKSRDCTYLKVKVEKIQYSDIDYVRNISGEKYKKCLRCIGNGTDVFAGNIPVYISKYGNRYHIINNCNAISKNIMAVKLSEVCEMRACSKCR